MRDSTLDRSGEKPANTRARGLVALRIAGLVAFVAWLWTSQAGLEETLSELAALDPRAWGLAFAFNLIPPLVIALRMKWLLRVVGHDLRYVPLANDSLRAAALNTVTLMGAGDLYRLQRLRTAGVPLAKGSALAVLDRLFGIGSLVALVIVLQWTGIGQSISLARGWTLAIVAGVVLAMAAALFLALEGPRQRLMSRLKGLLGAEFDVRDLRPGVLAGLIALSLVANVSWVLCVYVLGLGLGLELTAGPYFDAAPLVALASLVPITIGGVGLREAGYVLLLGAYGVAPAACIALGLAQYSTFLAIAIVGGALFAMPDRMASPAASSG